MFRPGWLRGLGGQRDELKGGHERADKAGKN